jgi:tripartite-type tricarboxylate transporter receptor subunit TctC
MPVITRRCMQRAALALVATVHAWSAAPAAAQDYPTKPVRIIVPFGAGGPTDVTARLIAQQLSQRLGQQFIVENVPGAGGNIGTGQVARAKPDGYRLLVASTGHMVNPSLYASVPYDPKKDFAPLTLIAASPNVLTVHPSVPARTVMELVEAIRKDPKKYSFAQPATGSTPHLSGELFKLHFKLDQYTMIPFHSAAQAITSTVGNQTPTAWTALPPAMAAIKAGQLRALAVTSEKRVEGLPDVPTMAEAGVEGQEAETLTSMFAPAGTPKAIIDRLYQAVAESLKEPEVEGKLKGMGFVPVGNTPEEWGKRVDVEIEKWGKVIRDAKIPQIK